MSLALPASVKTSLGCVDFLILSIAFVRTGLVRAQSVFGKVSFITGVFSKYVDFLSRIIFLNALLTLATFLVAVSASIFVAILPISSLDKST